MASAAADDTRLNFGGLTVLKAGMNQDLRMADKLKATGPGNLLTLFSEPDIVVHERGDDLLQVEIRGSPAAILTMRSSGRSHLRQSDQPLRRRGAKGISDLIRWQG